VKSDEVKGKVVSVLNWLSTIPWRHVGKWRHSSNILDIGTRLRWVLRFTLRPFYPREKCRYGLCRRLGGPQSRSGPYGEEKNIPPLGEIEHRLVSCPARSLVAIPTELSRLINRMKVVRNAHTILAGKLKTRKLIETTRLRSETKIKI
jgi:hypothetical protein